MKAHKVPATYYDGWQSDENKGRFYIFYKGTNPKKGISKKYRKVKQITNEHKYFMEENFYFIDLSIPGIVYALKDEITDFLKNERYSIIYNDTDSDDENFEKVVINNYDDFTCYFRYLKTWEIEYDGKNISTDDFKKNLNDYISLRVGNIIEKDYFANYLEPKWKRTLESIVNKVSILKQMDDVIIDKIDDFLEFFIIQYLRVEQRISNDIDPVISMVENVLEEMGLEQHDIKELKDDGFLSPEAHFFKILLDTAKGDNHKVNNQICKIKKNYIIDILEAPIDYYYVTSANPVVISKKKKTINEEILFPINKKYCAKVKIRHDMSEKGKYIRQTGREVKIINNIIINESNNIIISNKEDISKII